LKALLLRSSQQTRKEASTIFNKLLAHESELKTKVTHTLLTQLDKALKNDA